MATIAEQKSLLRKEMRQLRARIDAQTRAQAAMYCNDLLFSDRGLNLFSRYRSFASYMSFGDEFQTDHLHDRLLRQCPFIQVPRYDVFTQQYVWEKLAIGSRIEEGPHGILQPKAGEKNVNVGEIDVVFVPGLCFDVCGGRLGYGAGIYDRLLRQVRQTTIKIGLAFEGQLLREALPQEPHDMCMDYIVTGHAWVDCRRARQVRRG